MTTWLPKHSLLSNSIQRAKMHSSNALVNALVCASKDGSLEDVQAILSQPRDLWDSQLGDSLYQAILRLDPEMVQLLLANGAKLDRSSFILLRMRGNISLLEVFLAHGWDLDSTELDDGEPFIRQVLMWSPS